MAGLSGTVLKQRMRAGQPVFGAWLQLTDPIAAEVMARVGFDFLVIDTEHAPINRETLQTLLLMFEGAETTPLVRVPSTDEVWIKWALDCGAEGVVAPLIRTAEDARQIVAACKYAPEGARGFGPRAAAGFGRHNVEYRREANERIIVVVQIEQAEAVRNLDGILAVPGLDAVLVGRLDLADSLGVPGQFGHPDLLKAVDSVLAKAQAAGMPVVMDAPVVEVPRWREKGVRLFTLGLDWVWMRQASLEALATARQPNGAI